ncbi:MAG: TasA family protein, partial [Dethiobacteria bacterium]
MKKKKNVLIGVLVFSLAALLAVGTWAWFTATADPVTNQFTAGTVKIEINEHGFTDVVNWNPGDTTEKKVSVKSKGSKASYVRVSLTPVWEDN